MSPMGARRLRREGRLPRSPYIRSAREPVVPDAIPREPPMTPNVDLEMDDSSRLRAPVEETFGFAQMTAGLAAQ